MSLVSTPAELDALRDEMCVRLLEATSTHTALARARREEQDGVPAYDRDPRRNHWRGLQPRDLVLVCGAPHCGQRFIWRGNNQHGEGRFCSAACRERAHYWRGRDGEAA